MNPLELYLRHLRPTGVAGVGAVCTQTAPGEDTCWYQPGEKEPQIAVILDRARARLRESLSASSRDLSALRRMVSSRDPHGDLLSNLRSMRDFLRRHAGYLDDPPGRDSVQTLARTLERGMGDCLSFTIALTAGAKALNLPVTWRLVGFPEDPSRHIYPVIAGVPVEASDPMPPIGKEYQHFTTRREVAP